MLLYALLIQMLDYVELQRDSLDSFTGIEGSIQFELKPATAINYIDAGSCGKARSASEQRSKV